MVGIYRTMYYSSSSIWWLFYQIYDSNVNVMTSCCVTFYLRKVHISVRHHPIDQCHSPCFISGKSHKNKTLWRRMSYRITYWYHTWSIPSLEMSDKVEANPNGWDQRKGWEDQRLWKKFFFTYLVGWWELLEDKSIYVSQQGSVIIGSVPVLSVTI